MASYVNRALIAEEALRRIAQNAESCVNRIVAHSTIIEAALNVIMKHDLLDDLVTEHSRLCENKTDTGASDADKT